METEEKKYIMTDDTIVVDGHKLSRIKALRDFGNVKAGELGGYISCEKNLSHSGTCWVRDDALVMNDALVMDDSIVRDHALVMDDSIVRDHAFVCHYAIIRDRAKVGDYAIIRDRALLCEDARVGGSSHVGDFEIVKD